MRGATFERLLTLTFTLGLTDFCFFLKGLDWGEKIIYKYKISF